MASKRRINVSLEPEVIKYLDELAKEAQRDRSWVIAAFTRLHRQFREEKQLNLKLPDPAEKVIQFD